MTGNELGEALRSGRRVYGTALASPSPRWPDVMPSLGVDFVFIDTEHIAIDRHDLSWMCQTYRAQGLPPVVRIPSPDPYQACQVLDGGACGVIAPYVERPEEVRALRGAVKLRPLKGQRLEAILAGDESPGPELAAYLAKANADNVMIVNIESAPALDALDAILDVPDLDAVLIGPHDLSCSLGIPEQYGHATFLDAVSTVIRKARAKNVGAGIHFWDSIDPMIDWAREGMNLLIHSFDITAFTRTLRADLDALRQALGDERVSPEDRDEPVV